jgi:hypothetical protein
MNADIMALCQLLSEHIAKTEVSMDEVLEIAGEVFGVLTSKNLAETAGYLIDLHNEKNAQQE